VVVAALISFGATVGVDAFHRVARVIAPPVPASAAAPNVVHIRWQDSDVSPSASAGRICVVDASIGRVCASYAPGEKPADVLARELQSLGVTVESAN
jgi:hypothetical protein